MGNPFTVTKEKSASHMSINKEGEKKLIVSLSNPHINEMYNGQ
jgi:hypothetical protein